MSAHVDSLIDDYVLGLLPAGERRAVEQHAAHCPRCAKLLAQERRQEARLAAAIRGATTAPAGRMEALWPNVAAAVLPRPRFNWWPRWRTALATLATALVILVGAMGTINRFDGWMMATYTPTTASGSASPTASSTPTVLLTQDSVACRPAPPAVCRTPEPLATSYSPQPQPNPSAPPLAGR